MPAQQCGVPAWVGLRLKGGALRGPPHDVSVEGLVRQHVKALHAGAVVLGRVAGLGLARLEHGGRKVAPAQQHHHPHAARRPQALELAQEAGAVRLLVHRLDVVLHQDAAPHGKGLAVCSACVEVRARSVCTHACMRVLCKWCAARQQAACSGARLVRLCPGRARYSKGSQHQPRA